MRSSWPNNYSVVTSLEHVLHNPHKPEDILLPVPLYEQEVQLHKYHNQDGLQAVEKMQGF